MKFQKVTVLSGGTGSVKLVRGLYSIKGSQLTVIVNVGDNVWMHGLYVCPDIDTIVYGLAGILDEVRGWGIRDDTFNLQQQLAKFGQETWFKLGDKDLATHVWRSIRLREGARLSEITNEMCDRLNVKAKVIPATDEAIETRIVAGMREMHFQEFWVKRGGRDNINGVKYIGVQKARPSPSVVESILSADAVVICPANPITSIGPILAVPGVDQAMKRTSAYTLAVSPIVGKTPVSGPAGKLMSALGIEVSPAGVAKVYQRFLDEIVLHLTDQEYIVKLSNMGIKARITNILMKSLKDSLRLAKFLVANH